MGIIEEVSRNDVLVAEVAELGPVGTLYEPTLLLGIMRAYSRIQNTQLRFWPAAKRSNFQQVTPP